MQPTASHRLHALDAVRAGALLLGIAAHATMSFFPMPIWVVQDSDPTGVLSTAFGVQHIFRMSLFFMIAGFFAHMMLHRRGAMGFIADRAKRIALVFAVFWPPLFISFIALVIWSVIKANGGELPEGGETPALTWRTVPLLHTWFLYVLVILYAGALSLAGASRLIDRKGRIGALLDACIRALAKTHLLPFVLALPLAGVFFLHQSWVGWGGIRTPDTGLVPNIAAMVGFGTAFGFGWLLHRQMDLLSVWRRWWPAYLAVAVALTFAVMRMMQAAPEVEGATLETLALLETQSGADLLTAIAYPLTIWAWCFALTGMALRFLSGENRVIRYLADSSYWLYLIHLPIVIALQIVVSQWPAGWYVKFPVILIVATAIMLASYQLLVRGTPVGGWINGRRYGRKARARQASVAAAE